MDNPPLVSICCLAYNHASFIRQCLDGFLMQETSFPFEVLIHDDASTDGTADIIREYEQKYPDIIKPVYQSENQYSKGVRISFTYNFPRARGKYIAMCEGDDYWIDPFKLQKQADFLEANPEYSLCSHRYRILDEETGEWNPDYVGKFFKESCDGISFDNELNLLQGWFTKTMTTMFCKSAYYAADLQRYKYGRDVHLFYHILKQGKGYCMNYNAAVYRKHINGIWSKESVEKRDDITYKVCKDLYMGNKDDVFLRENFRRNLNHNFRSNIKKRTITQNTKALAACIYYNFKFWGIKNTVRRVINIRNSK